MIHGPRGRVRVVSLVIVLIAGGIVGSSAVAATASPMESTAQEGEPTGQASDSCDSNAIYDESIASVVTVRVFDQQGDRSLGSGWVYAVNGSDALLVTNAHVVEGGIGADVRFSGGEWRNVVELVGIDPFADLAVLRVEDVPSGVEPLGVARSLPDQGDEVAALGSPLGLEGTVTRGIVSAVDRSVTVATGGGTYTVADAIQIDTPINPGNSGGPLVNCTGEVVGVNFAGVSPLTGQNINFAISASMVERIVPALLEDGSFNHSYIGIRGVSVSPTMARINGINATGQGVLVESVVAGGPADGVLAGSPRTDRVTGIPIGGDVIVAVNGTDVGDVEDLRDLLFEETRPGETVSVTVIRDDARETVELTIAARPLPRERSLTEEPPI